ARLARAVRADQAVDLAVPDREAHVGERMHAAEALADPPGRQKRQVAVGSNRCDCAHVDHHASGFAAALPPEGALFAPWGSPAALMSRSSPLSASRARACAAPRAIFLRDGTAS